MTLAELGPYAGVVVAALVSGVAPLVVVEIYLVAIVADGANPAIVVALAALATVGAKLPFYGALRVLPLERLRARWPRWRRLLDALTPRRALALVAASSLVGLPPFSLVAGIAALGHMRTLPFAALVLAGRTLRFAIVIAFTTWAGDASA